MRTIEWRHGTVLTLDQLKLPGKTVILEIHTPEEMVEAIVTMRIRGAPLLGAAAAYALALTAYRSNAKRKTDLINELNRTAAMIRGTRPTAVNLFWAIDRILKKVEDFSGNANGLAATVVREAEKIADEDVAANRLIGRNGAKLISNGDTILTHCNAGALATVDYGTALGIIRTAWEQEKKIKVIATETRPNLQGARLTTYELKQAGIPVTLITDNMVGYVMHERMISKVVVGADRIVQDAVVNKIGTFTIAVLAKEHEIEFYVAAPKSTFDLSHKSADVIIEERNPDEVTHLGSQRIAADGINVLNPAFDVTPLKYVTGIVHEDGILFKKDFAKFRTANR